MKTKSGTLACSRGFTLAELLTAMAIMAILIGLLVPTLTLVQKTAQKVRQKSQFHGIDIAMESFRTDFGDYPDSSYKPGFDSGYCGAQKLAEAIVGYDGFGVHPKTGFRSDGMNDVDGDNVPELIYDVVNGITGSNGYVETAADNHKVRKGPYLELDSANAVKLDDLYANPVGTTPLNSDTYVLADMFGKVTNQTTHKKTGMPILYYKADVGGIDHDPPSMFPLPARNVYNILDNSPIYKTAPPFGNTPHPMAAAITGEPLFYDRTWNRNFPGPPRRPYK
ncbi:MAG: type II secretion system protein, partial [Planctomycetes bacterium]|nr:type II secretion system protein [Planctomycetota bacterium]